MSWPIFLIFLPQFFIIDFLLDCLLFSPLLIFKFCPILQFYNCLIYNQTSVSLLIVENTTLNISATRRLGFLTTPLQQGLILGVTFTLLFQLPPPLNAFLCPNQLPQELLSTFYAFTSTVTEYLWCIPLLFQCFLFLLIFHIPSLSLLIKI